jgi:hypothetical protein
MTNDLLGMADESVCSYTVGMRTMIQVNYTIGNDDTLKSVAGGCADVKRKERRSMFL